MFDKFFWEFFQWFGLAIVAEDSVVHKRSFFLIEGGIEGLRVSERLLFKDKNGESLGNEFVEMKLEIGIFIDKTEIGKLVGANVRKWLGTGIWNTLSFHFEFKISKVL